MLAFDLTLTLMIIINALVLNQGVAAKALVPREGGMFSTVDSQDYSRVTKDYLQPATVKGRKTKKIRNNHRRNWYLNPIILKLENVIDKYEQKKTELEVLYSGVVPCGLSKCEKFRGLIPENQDLKKFKCFGNHKGFKKVILKLLSDFHEGVQKIEKSFQSLIEFENLPQINNGSRRKVLEELRTDIKTLNLEVEAVMTNKRLNLERRSIDLSSFLSKPKYRTHLMIYEWRIIRDSKRFLKDWKKTLQKIFKCWKKRKREKIFQDSKSNELEGPPKKIRHLQKDKTYKKIDLY